MSELQKPNTDVVGNVVKAGIVAAAVGGTAYGAYKAVEAVQANQGAENPQIEKTPDPITGNVATPSIPSTDVPLVTQTGETVTVTQEPAVKTPENVEGQLKSLPAENSTSDELKQLGRIRSFGPVAYETLVGPEQERVGGREILRRMFLQSVVWAHDKPSVYEIMSGDDLYRRVAEIIAETGGVVNGVDILKGIEVVLEPEEKISSEGYTPSGVTGNTGQTTFGYRCTSSENGQYEAHIAVDLDRSGKDDEESNVNDIIDANDALTQGISGCLAEIVGEEDFRKLEEAFRKGLGAGSTAPNPKYNLPALSWPLHADLATGSN